MLLLLLKGRLNVSALVVLACLPLVLLAMNPSHTTGQNERKSAAEKRKSPRLQTTAEAKQKGVQKSYGTRSKLELTSKSPAKIAIRSAIRSETVSRRATTTDVRPNKRQHRAESDARKEELRNPDLLSLAEACRVLESLSVDDAAATEAAAEEPQKKDAEDGATETNVSSSSGRIVIDALKAPQQQNVTMELKRPKKMQKNESAKKGKEMAQEKPANSMEKIEPTFCVSPKSENNLQKSNLEKENDQIFDQIDAEKAKQTENGEERQKENAKAFGRQFNDHGQGNSTAFAQKTLSDPRNERIEEIPKNNEAGGTFEGKNVMEKQEIIELDDDEEDEEMAEKQPTKSDQQQKIVIELDDDDDDDDGEDEKMMTEHTERNDQTQNANGSANGSDKDIVPFNFADDLLELLNEQEFLTDEEFYTQIGIKEKETQKSSKNQQQKKDDPSNSNQQNDQQQLMLIEESVEEPIPIKTILNWQSDDEEETMPNSNKEPNAIFVQKMANKASTSATHLGEPSNSKHKMPPLEEAVGIICTESIRAVGQSALEFGFISNEIFTLTFQSSVGKLVEVISDSKSKFNATKVIKELQEKLKFWLFQQTLDEILSESAEFGAKIREDLAQKTELSNGNNTQEEMQFMFFYVRLYHKLSNTMKWEKIGQKTTENQSDETIREYREWFDTLNRGLTENLVGEIRQNNYPKTTEWFKNLCQLEEAIELANFGILFILPHDTWQSVGFERPTTFKDLFEKIGSTEIFKQIDALSDVNCFEEMMNKKFELMDPLNSNAVLRQFKEIAIGIAVQVKQCLTTTVNIKNQPSRIVLFLGILNQIRDKLDNSTFLNISLPKYSMEKANGMEFLAKCLKVLSDEFNSFERSVRKELGDLAKLRKGQLECGGTSKENVGGKAASDDDGSEDDNDDDEDEDEHVGKTVDHPISI